MRVKSARLNFLKRVVAVTRVQNPGEIPSPHPVGTARG